MDSSLQLPLFLAAADGYARVAYESWHVWAPIVAFVCTFSVFVYLVIRAIRMKPRERDHAASLPLEPDHANRDSSLLP